MPAETVFEAAARELVTAQQQRLIGRVAGRVNRVQGGLRSVFVLTGRRVGDASGDSWRERMAGINPAWEEVGTWHALRTAGERFTARHYLAAIDLTRLPDGSVVRQAPDRRIYVPLFVRTLMVSLGVTLLCLVLGYPLAHLIAHSPRRRGGILLALVLVPFWTSLLVFILAIGYYITPALVGGSSGQLISNMVAYHMQTSLDWGLASALGAIILVCVTGLYILYDRIAGGERVSVA